MHVGLTLITPVQTYDWLHHMLYVRQILNSLCNLSFNQYLTVHSLHSKELGHLHSDKNKVE